MAHPHGDRIPVVHMHAPELMDPANDEKVTKPRRTVRLTCFRDPLHAQHRLLARLLRMRGTSSSQDSLIGNGEFVACNASKLQHVHDACFRGFSTFSFGFLGLTLLAHVCTFFLMSSQFLSNMLESI
jgi:hypothetical protein